MTVVYYTSTYFLDISVELIQVLKNQVNLHVFIEITPHSKNMGIIDVDELPTGKKLLTPQELLSPENYAQLQPYLEGTASVHFVLHHHPTGLSFSTLQACAAVQRYVKKFRPDIIHFEAFTPRTMGLVPYLFSYKKVFFTMHDPVPHSGEQSWKISLPYFCMFHLPVKKYFILYSEYARNLFNSHYPKVKAPKLLVPLQPYSYYGQLAPALSERTHLLFFGRISPYKGVDVLLKAMPAVLEQCPDEKLVIAGKTTPHYTLDDQIAAAYPDHVRVLNRYILNQELADLITRAKVIICPYLDATQSGVLMTAFALRTPVIASRVGSFPEFVQDGVNSLLVEPGNPELLADKINQALADNCYQQMSRNIAAVNTTNAWYQSLSNELLPAYYSEPNTAAS